MDLIQQKEQAPGGTGGDRGGGFPLLRRRSILHVGSADPSEDEVKSFAEILKAFYIFVAAHKLTNDAR